MTIDLDAMSLRELRRLEVDVHIALNRARQVERVIVLQKLTETAAAYGLKLNDLFGPKHARNKPVVLAVLPPSAKYANPRKKSQTWGGRGRRPFWLKRALKRPGAKLETFAVRHG